MTLTTRAGKAAPLSSADHDNNLLGVQHGSPASLAALLSRDTSTMADGLKVFIPGEGFLTWSAASTAQSDGVSVFVPDNLQSTEQEVSKSRTGLRADIGPMTLGHTGLIFGSVEIVYSDGAGSAASGSFVTDWEMHGHSLAVQAGPLLHTPEINHANGTLVPYGLGSNIGSHKLRKLLDAHTAGANFTVRYKYATGAGRWLRALEPGAPYTPRMIGCTPDDPTVNDYNRLAWLYSRSIEAERPILIDAWYYFKGTLELNDGIEIRQERPWGHAGLKVCPWSTIPVIDHMSDVYDDTLPPAIFDTYSSVMIQGIGAKTIRFKGLHYHGNLENNTDFLSDANYDTTDLASQGAVSQSLRESPSWCGIAVQLQSGRTIEDTLKVYLEDVQIGDFGGSCLIGAQYTRHFVGRNVALGVSMSGRVKYGGSGNWENLWLYGYSRTAVERSYSGNVRGFRYTWKRPDGTTPVRVWPENASPVNITGTLSTPLNTGLGHPRGNSFLGLDWFFGDVPTSEPETTAGETIHMGFNLKCVGNVIQGRIDTPTGATPFQVFKAEGDSNEGAIQVSADLDIYSRGTGGVSPLISNNGGWHSGSDIRMRIHETYDPVVEVIGTGDASETTFADTFTDLPVVAGTLTVVSGNIIGWDDRAGAISGTGISGTINYETGAISVTFGAAPANGAAVTAEYVSNITSPRTPTPTLPTLPSCQAPQVPVTLPSGYDPEAYINRQDISIHLVSEIAFGQLINLPGIPGLGQAIDPEAVMPTTVRLSGRIENVTNKLYLGANNNGPAAGSAALPIRVLCDGLIFRVFDPSELFVGDAPLLDNAFEVIKLSGCSTPEGWRSEQDGIFDILGSDLTSGYHEVQTNLLWRPRVVIPSFRSAEAFAHFTHVEIVTVVTGNPNTENAIQPKLRFHFSGAAAGAVLTMGWSAAVSPF